MGRGNGTSFPKGRLPQVWPCLLAVVLWMWALPLQAHRVAELALEAEFQADGSFVCRVTLDPRLFLAADPSAMPPVGPEWFLDQDPEAWGKSQLQAAERLSELLKTSLGKRVLDWKGASWQAMDGNSNGPLTRDSAETHLLATLRGRVESGQGPFAVSLATSSPVALIVLTQRPDDEKPQVQALFAGETSQGLEVPQAKAAWSVLKLPAMLAFAMAFFAAWRRRRSRSV